MIGRLFIDGRRSIAFWLWLMVPVLLVIALHLSTEVCCRYVGESLAWRQAMAQLLPDMILQQDAARKETGLFTLSREQGLGIIEALGAKLNNMTTQGKFRIDSLGVEKGGADAAMNVFQVNLNGSGDLPSTARFLYNLQASERLLNVDYARLSPQKGGKEENFYNVELSFRYQMLPP